MNASTTAKRIRTARERAKLTQKELSAAVEVSQSYISQIESDTKTPSLQVLRRIATATRTKPGKLLGDEG